MTTHSCCFICQGIKGESGPSGPPGLQGVQVSCLSPKSSGEQCFSIPTLVRVFLCHCVYPILRPGLTLVCCAFDWVLRIVNNCWFWLGRKERNSIKVFKLIILEVFASVQLLMHWKLISSDFSPDFVFYCNLINIELCFDLVWVQINSCFFVLNTCFLGSCFSICLGKYTRVGNFVEFRELKLAQCRVWLS